MEKLEARIRGCVGDPLVVDPEVLEKVREIEGVKSFNVVEEEGSNRGAVVLEIETEDLIKAVFLWLRIRAEGGAFPAREGQTAETHFVVVDNPQEEKSATI